MKSSTAILLPYARRQWSALALAALSTLFVTAAELARPFPLKLVIDHLLADNRASAPFTLGHADLVLLAAVAALVLAIALVEALATYVMEVRLRRAGERIIHDLRIGLYAHLQRLSLKFHDRRRTGDLVTRVTGDVNAVGQLFAESLGALTVSVLLLAGMLVVSLVIDPVLALTVFAVSPLLFLVTHRFRRRLRAASRDQRAREGEIASLAAESLAAMREVKAFGAEGFEHRLTQTSEQRRQAGVETSQIEGRFGRLIDVLGAVSAALVLVVGVFRVASGALSPGDLVVMVAYAKRVYRPLRDIARQSGRISRSMARADRIAEILAADDVLEERRDAHRGERARGELAFDAVSFSYEPDRHALAEVSLRIPAGQKVALVGRSGAGKSTLAGLTARFHDPESGSVLVDGRDARDCSLAWLRDQVGLVLQDTVLFSGSVAENIAFGSDASIVEIARAAKAAGAHGFISELPQGYHTELGARGVGLSGGQRQRLAIARTLLRNPAILVLDEPTTGLDARSEAEVLAGLEVLMRGRTTIVITHSPALAARADRVIVLEEGRVTSDGPPADAVARPAASAVGRRVPVPEDSALPQLWRLLDPAEIAPFLARSLEMPADGLDVRVRYLRYKPQTNLVVHYDVGVGGRWHEAVAMIASRAYLERRAGKPENVALARLVDGRSPVAMPLRYEPEVGALIQWLPLDLALPALAEPPAQLVDRLRAAGVKTGGGAREPDRLAYKPRRRAVLGLEDHVLKLYADETEFLAAVLGLGASSRLSAPATPNFVTFLPELRLTVQSRLNGKRPGHPGDVAYGAGAILAELHTAQAPMLRRERPHDQLTAAASSASFVAALRPELRGRIETLLDRLEDSRPEANGLVPSHGDFNARQLVIRRGDLAVVDFDGMCLAPAALDPAIYGAYLVLGGPGDLERARVVLEDLLEGYGERPPGLDWYLATSILRRAPRPFRYLDDHWPELLEGMLAASEEAAP